MPHHSPFRYCPLCATPLELRDDNGSRRPTCPSCGYVHYRNPAPAAGVLVHERGRVLLVKRRYEPRAGAWCIPAGFVEYGETPRHCAVRELREETGLECRLGGLFGVYAGFDDPRVRAILILYLAERAGGTLLPGDDAIEAKYFPLGRPPRDIAFEAHRQALREFSAHLKVAAKKLGAKPKPAQRKRATRARKKATVKSAMPPRRGPAAPPR